MIAAVPSILQEIAAWIGVLTIVLGGGAALLTRKPVRWVWTRLVAGPFGEWVKRTVADSPTGQLVAYHLGPNGETPPIHSRLRRLEQAHGIEADESL